MSNENPLPPIETYNIRIARDGSWWHNGGRIERIALVKLFASVLKCDNDGNFWLITPAERGQVVVEDAPFVAVEMQVKGRGMTQSLAFRTNLDEWVEAGPDHRLVFRDRGKPYIEIRNGLEALANRAVYYELMDIMEEQVNARSGLSRIGVWSHGQFFAIPL